MNYIFRMCNLFLIIGLSIFSLCHGQSYNFHGIQGQLDAMLDNARRLKNFIALEKNNYEHSVPNVPVTTPEPLMVTDTAFTTQVEARLREMTPLVAALGGGLSTCPGFAVVPEAPRNINITTETVGVASTISLAWEPPTLEPANMQYRVNFYPIDKYGQSIAQRVVFTVCERNQTSASITDLDPDSRFNISVTTLAGPSIESKNSVVQVKTNDQIPPAPTYLNAHDVTPNSVTLSWDKPQLIGTIIAYRIHGKNGLGESFTEVIKPPVEQFVVTNLPEGTLHKFVVNAESDNGEGDASPQAIITTLPFDPPAPLNLNCPIKTPDTIVLRWTPVPVYPGMGLLRGYNITMKDEMFNVIDSFIFNDINTFTTNVTNLNAYTDFYFTASSFTRRRQGDQGFILYCKTKPTYPSPPRDLVASNNTYEPPSALLTWTPSKYMNDKSVSYVMEWGVFGGTKRMENVSEGFMYFTSDFLDHKVTHTFELTAVNSVGYSTPVKVNFTSPDREVMVPPNVTVHRKKKDKTILRVEWKLPAKKIYGYFIMYRKFEWVYTGRWNLEKLYDPNSTSTEIKVQDEQNAYIVVIRCMLDPPGTAFNPITENDQAYYKYRYQNPPTQNYPPNVAPPQIYPQNNPPQNYPQNNPPQNYPQNNPPQNYPQNNSPQNVGSNQQPGAVQHTAG